LKAQRVLANVSRLGIFGGSFDPIHIGHLIVAEILAYRLELDHVLFLPAARPPHKPGHTLAPNADRLRMIELAIEGAPNFSVSEIDLNRPGPSYTSDTLAELREQVGHDAAFEFLMGMDSLSDFPRWYRPDQIAERARLGVARRPGVDVSARDIEILVPASQGRIDVVAVPLIDISSSDIRDRIRTGQPYRFQVMPGVAEYIRSNGLYLNEP
jgi:nicotinate-nucleotide adenylyltransferase